ncbi:ACT domain-containing protein [Nocardia thailandica]
MVVGSPSHPPLGVAVLGTGPLRAELARVLLTGGRELRSRVGAALALRAATGDPAERGTWDGIDLVVDSTVTGAVLGAALGALRAGRSVVTANTALVAGHGAELAAAAQEHGGDLFFEAAVAGGVPVVRPLTQSLSGDRVRQVLGVFDPAVSDRDPAAQAAILATLAFHTRVEPSDVHAEDFPTPGPHDLAAAAALGLRLRPLTVCARVPGHPSQEDGGKDHLSVRVHPALLPAAHPLVAIERPYSAVAVEAEHAGRLMFSGRGDGPTATASALLGDLVTAARNRVHGGRAPRASYYAELPVAPVADTPTRYYLNLRVTDHAGALARVATVFAEHGVGIARVLQEHHDGAAHLILLTHRATDAALADTVDALGEAGGVLAVVTRWRVEGMHG